eukprot:Gb_26282 [translate_table: standard]
MRGSNAAMTPNRSKGFKANVNASDENRIRKNGNVKSFNSPRRNIMAQTTQPALSSLNLNAFSGHREDGRFVQRNRHSGKNAREIEPERDRDVDGSPVAPKGSQTVVWNNAVFQSEGIWGARTCSTSTDSDAPTESLLEVSSCAVKVAYARKEDYPKVEQKEPFASNHGVASSASTPDVDKNHSPDIESTASTWHIPNANQGTSSDKSKTHSASSSCCVERKALQSKKALFSTGDAQNTASPHSPPATISVALQDQISKHQQTRGEDEESRACDIDLGIQEIEREIFRLTQKLTELRLQKAAERRNQELQDTNCGPSEAQKSIAADHNKCEWKVTPDKTEYVIAANVVGDKSKGPKEQELKSSEKQRRGRIVSAKFLLQDSRVQSKAEQKPLDSRKNGWRQMSPKIQRRAASLGPSEHTRFSQTPCKTKEDENGVEKFTAQSGRKWYSRKSEIAKNVVGEMGSLRRCDRIDTKSRSLSLSPRSHRSIDRKVANLKHRAGSMSSKKPGNAALFKSDGTQWLHCKKLFQESDIYKSTNTNGTSFSSRLQPGLEARKPSPVMKNARFVASRYGQMSTPSNDKGAQTPACSMSSLRNVYGKRAFPEDENDSLKGKMDNSAFKRRYAVAGSPNGRNCFTRNGYPGRSVATPKSKTPIRSTPRLETKKTSSPFWKDGKLSGRHASQGTKEKCNRQKESLNKKAFTNSSDLFQLSCLEKKPMPSENQGNLAEYGANNYCFSVGITSPDGLEPDRMKLPKIKTMRFTAKSPRDSGCIKRAVDRIGKKSLFASDTMNSIDERSPPQVDSNTSRRIDHEIKHTLSFEDNDAGCELA